MEDENKLMLIDIHTHKANTSSDVVAIVNFSPNDNPMSFFSIGIHPWFISQNHDFEIIERLALNAVAIGECGLDKLRGVDFNTQIDIFEKHISLAQKLHKPIIIHCVKAYDIILKLSNKFINHTPWIIHGCYTSPEWIKQALQHNIFFSLGIRAFSLPLAMKMLDAIPINRLFLETDDSNYNILDVYNCASQKLSIPINKLIKQVETNYKSIFKF